jgi:hypothetical protein
MAVHMSPGDISSIIKRHTREPQADPEKGKQQQQEKTIDTKVFKLLDEGKTPIQVAITLNCLSSKSSNVSCFCITGLNENYVICSIIQVFKS